MRIVRKAIRWIIFELLLKYLIEGSLCFGLGRLWIPGTRINSGWKRCQTLKKMVRSLLRLWCVHEEGHWHWWGRWEIWSYSLVAQVVRRVDLLDLVVTHWSGNCAISFWTVIHHKSISTAIILFKSNKLFLDFSFPFLYHLIILVLIRSWDQDVGSLHRFFLILFWYLGLIALFKTHAIFFT